MSIIPPVRKIVASCLALGFLGSAAFAAPNVEITPGKGMKVEYAEGKYITIGADMRVRLTRVDRNVIWPEGPPTTPVDRRGPALEWLRVRTRLMLGMDLWDGAKLDARLVNRVHNYSSHFLNPNDNGPGTWQFPDEVIFDQLMLTLTDPAGIDGLTLKIGRQDFMLGNGMIILEGTPYDQGRTIYFDGISAKYAATECDTVTAFIFYNQYLDKFVPLEGENRNLRRGDVLTTGIDWTHVFSDAVKTELYYIYVNVNDNDEAAANTTSGQFDPNGNATIQTVGARLFGSPLDWMDYSLEVAHEIGYYDENPNPGAANTAEGDADGEGWMVDARLTLKYPEAALAPKVMFEYTYLSGDDTSTTGTYEGWDAIFAEYPIWREELLPIMINSNWTNLHQFRTEVGLTLYECKSRKTFSKVTFTGAAAYLMADEPGTGRTNGGGNGSHFGDLYSAFLDIQVIDRVKVSFEAAFFEAGNYWNTDADSEWLRMQTVFTF